MLLWRQFRLSEGAASDLTASRSRLLLLHMFCMSGLFGLFGWDLSWSVSECQSPTEPGVHHSRSALAASGRFLDFCCYATSSCGARVCQVASEGFEIDVCLNFFMPLLSACRST